MYEKVICSDCGLELRSRVAGFRVAPLCPRCSSQRLALSEREQNAPLPASVEISVGFDSGALTDRHRKRTVVGVDTGKVAAERAIALEERRLRWERRALWGGVMCGYAALIIELWRMGQ